MSTEITSAILRVAPFLIVIVGLRIGIKRQRVTTQDLGMQPPVSYGKFFAWWSLFTLFIIVTELIFFRTGLLEVTHWHHDPPSSFIRIFGIVILAPVTEELLFRGLFLQKLIQWKINKHISVLIQAFIFVLLHSFTYQNTLSSNIGIAQGFLDACLYAYARFSTQSIYTPMAMHATGNLTAVIEQFIL